jgi:probable HAF family extracellular repeat protein
MLVNWFGIVSLAIAIGESNSIASDPRAVLSPRVVPLVSTNTEKAVGRSHDVMPLESLKAKDQGRRPSRAVGHVLNLTRGKVNPDAPGQNTIPHWSDSFTYNGLVYNYTMVGTDPKRGSATTVIPTVLIPIRFVFADGNVFDATTDLVDGQTPIQGIINSPLFQNYDFNNNAGIYVGDGGSTGLVRVGNTQYGDAFQRANFWNSVSNRSPNYHVLLGQPTVAAVQTVNVPYGSFDYYNDPVTGQHPLVDDQILFDLTASALTTANAAPNTLPIIVWGRVSGFGAGGYHGIITGSENSIQTFIATQYDTGIFYQFPGLSGLKSLDTYPLSHEILEWMNDPFVNNFTPGWDEFFSAPTPPVRCDSTVIVRDLLEVGDAVEFFVDSQITLPAPSYSYHVTEGVFIDFFTRSSRSRSYNGQYSFFEMGLPYGIVTPPSAPCTGHVEFTPTYVDFPGATFTFVTGINIPGLAVGFYDDSAGAEHGFTFDGLNYSTLDYPGSLLTQALRINNAGTVVGLFVDASGGTHGFSYQRGQWRQIDFPGASDTEAYGVNAAGDIVGVYDGSQPTTHAFLLQNGQYQRIDTPFGTQAEAFAINNPGSITGLGYTDPNGAATSFVLSHNTFSSFQFPGSIFSELSSINNSNDLAGFFLDPDGSYWGMVTVFGHPYQVFASLWGNDDLNRIFGYTIDDTGRPRGLIGTLPLQGNQH